MKILVTPPFNESQKRRLEASAPMEEYEYCRKEDLTPEKIGSFDVILGNLASPAQLEYADRLKWIQLNNAGTEGYCVEGRLPQGAILTNATGAYGLAISEYMISGLFLIRKKLQLYCANQSEGLWRPEGHAGVVEGATVAVIGLGDIGSTFAGKMKGLGCNVIGVKRRGGNKPECVDELYGTQELDKILPRADVVALCLPGTPDTYRILNRERIGLLAGNAIVINVGRGGAVDTEALSEALYAGRIGGAVLDVTDPEPLPPKHPIWKAPNTLITPHISGKYSLPETLEKISVIFADNLKRFSEGKELKNIIDPLTGYCR